MLLLDNKLMKKDDGKNFFTEDFYEWKLFKLH